MNSESPDPKPADPPPADPTPTPTSPTPSTSAASITHLPNASIFSAPPNTLLLHACNARGSWGAGVAASFKAHYPRAYAVYNKHCLHPRAPSVPGKEWQKSLLGTCLLIPPQKNAEEEEGGEEGGKGHWVGCLFTSWGYGRQVDGVEEIVESTKRAVVDLRRQLEGEGGKGVERVWSVKINSGMFGVEWARTEEVLRDGGVDMVIVTPAEGEGTGKKRKGKGGEGAEKKKKAKMGEGAEEDGGAAKNGGVGGRKEALRGNEGKRGQSGLDGWLK